MSRLNVNNVSTLSGQEVYVRSDFTGGFSFRNKFINGNFDIWQRGTSQTANGYGSADRWFIESVGSTKTASRQSFTIGQTDVPNVPTYFMRNVVSSVAGVGNYSVMYQRIEDVGTLNGQTVTLSFWAKADSNKNIAVEFVQNFGTGGSPSSEVNQISPQKFALTTTWTKYTKTVTLSSISGKTLGSDGNSWMTAIFWFDAGSNFNSRTDSLGQQSGTFDIAEVQLEEGTVATSFEQRPIGLELSLCQRYYWRIYAGGGNQRYSLGHIISTTQMTCFIQFPVQMRVAPSALEQSGTASHYLIAYAATASACSSVPTFSAATVNSSTFTFTVASGLTVGQAAQAASNSPNSYLGWSAEL